ncbi:oligosaccharide flippase family protein, partial [Verrucomicrobia bacterium]|nr:oligosaccharide flippase family protein [Verrucomicrobiota bacterium]
MGANVLNIPLNFVINMLAPRLLGSTGFGIFSFLTDSFGAVASFLDCGTSTYFFNRLSQKPDEHLFKRFYAGFTLLIIAFSTLCVAFLNGAGLSSYIWPNTSSRLVWYGLAFAIITWLSQVLNKMVDAYGLTIAGEIVRVGHRIFLASSLGLFLLLEVDSLDSFFLCQILLMALLCCAWVELLRRKGVVVVPGNKLAKDEIRSMAREAWSYSSPLLVFSAFNLLALLVDRWILQKFFGTQQQGYFGLGLKVGTVCFLFTSAMTP